jgi:hypothetical protein
VFLLFCWQWVAWLSLAGEPMATGIRTNRRTESPSKEVDGKSPSKEVDGKSPSKEVNGKSPKLFRIL